MRDICPVSRHRCNVAEICGMMFCAKAGASAGLHPISDTQLTKVERYKLVMAEQRTAARRALSEST